MVNNYDPYYGQYLDEVNEEDGYERRNRRSRYDTRQRNRRSNDAPIYEGEEPYDSSPADQSQEVARRYSRYGSPYADEPYYDPNIPSNRQSQSMRRNRSSYNPDYSRRGGSRTYRNRGDYDRFNDSDDYGSARYERGMYGTRSYSEDVGESYAGKGPKGWQRSDDRIREEVNEALARHHDINPSEVEVKVDNGVVTLEGTIEDRWMKRHMEDLIYSVFGVQDVHNRVRINRDDQSSAQSERESMSQANKNS